MGSAKKHQPLRFGTQVLLKGRKVYFRSHGEYPEFLDSKLTPRYLWGILQKKRGRNTNKEPKDFSFIGLDVYVALEGIERVYQVRLNTSLAIG